MRTMLYIGFSKTVLSALLTKWRTQKTSISPPSSFKENDQFRRFEKWHVPRACDRSWPNFRHYWSYFYGHSCYWLGLVRFGRRLKLHFCAVTCGSRTNSDDLWSTQSVESGTVLLSADRLNRKTGWSRTHPNPPIPKAYVYSKLAIRIVSACNNQLRAQHGAFARRACSAFRSNWNKSIFGIYIEIRPKTQTWVMLGRGCRVMDHFQISFCLFCCLIHCTCTLFSSANLTLFCESAKCTNIAYTTLFAIMVDTEAGEYLQHDVSYPKSTFSAAFRRRNIRPTRYRCWRMEGCWFSFWQLITIAPMFSMFFLHKRLHLARRWPRERILVQVPCICSSTRPPTAFKPPWAGKNIPKICM